MTATKSPSKSAREMNSKELVLHIFAKWKQDEATSNLFGPASEGQATDRLVSYLTLAIDDVEKRGVIRGLRMAIQDVNFFASPVESLAAEADRLEKELNGNKI